MKATNYMILSIVAVLAIVGILFGTGALSVIGEGVSEQCRINTSTGSCTMELTLPEYRAVQTYTLDLEMFSVPGPFINEIQVSPVAGLGPLIEEDDMDEPTNEQELETNYVYMYRVPDSFPKENLYALHIVAEADGWVQNTNDRDASVDMGMSPGYITYPYTASTINKCGESFDSTTCIVRHYDRDYSRTPNEWKFYTYNIKYFGSTNYDVYDDLDTDDSDYDMYYPGKFSGTMGREGTIIMEDVLAEIGATDYSQFAMIIRMDVDERWKGYTDFGISVPPRVYLSYAAELRPTNTKIIIGDVQADIISGQPYNATTADLAQAINTYCEARAVGDKCVVPITFQSDEDGIIKAVGESGQLRATSGETGREGGNLLTGFAFADIGEFAGNSFDFEGHATQAWITSVVLFLLVFGLIMFVGGKKK